MSTAKGYVAAVVHGIQATRSGEVELSARRVLVPRGPFERCEVTLRQADTQREIAYTRAVDEMRTEGGWLLEEVQFDEQHQLACMKFFRKVAP